MTARILFLRKFLIILGILISLSALWERTMVASSPLDEPDPGRPIAIDPGFDSGQTAEIGTTNTIITLTVNPQNRYESALFYYQQYLPSEGAAIDWTGNHTGCDEGTTSPAFREAVLRRINYFRAMAGVPAGVTFLDEYNAKAQKAALIMSVNNALDHSPPSNWDCYSADGAAGADNSNLSLGRNGPEVIVGYMKDTNTPSLGHRRWILHPQIQEMGTGDIPAESGFRKTNALWVIDSHTFDPRPATREAFTAWPPPGYTPYQVVFAWWSFTYPQADFSNASVSVASGGLDAPIEMVNIIDGTAGENTLGWKMAGISSVWPKPDEDTTYTVTIDNVVIDGKSRTFTYDVIVMDPSFLVFVHLPAIIK